MLEKEYGITHTTLQVDHAQEALLTLGRRGEDADDPHCADAHGPVHRQGPHDH
jgi:cobalt-zinc-cadmium efflux system protein